MTRQLPTGIYENLLTDALRIDVEKLKLQGWYVGADAATNHEQRAELLAHHVYNLLRNKLKQITGKTDAIKLSEQLKLTNQLIDFLNKTDERISNKAELLLELVEKPLAGQTAPTLTRPSLPLGETSLLVNGARDIQLASAIANEIPSANRIYLLCAFIRQTGLRLFRRELEQNVATGGQLHVISSVYTGSTERRALDQLCKLGAKVKISYDTHRTRLHAKAWLFHRDSGLHTAFIGSSNLTHAAQVDGLEWNIRLSVAKNREVIERFTAAFEQYWQEPEFEDYNPELDGDRLDQALNDERGVPTNGNRLSRAIRIDVKPKQFQLEVLDALKSERQIGRFRNLVVSATGTGKTWIAGFDYQRLRNVMPTSSLLFIAHRKEILRNSRDVFRKILRDWTFGELWVDGEKPTSGRHVFASVQSIHREINSIRPDHFDIIIIDEFHHAAAKSYEKILNRLKPQYLLGLTATPERTDGLSILHWFDDRVAFEMRLWDALDQGLLCPFHYFGINDPSDLSAVKFQRSKFDIAELDKVISGDDVRARHIRDALEDVVHNPDQMRALGFCASVKHAHFMAMKFNSFGYPAKALDAKTQSDDRKDAVQRFMKGELRILFTVDLFNEGIDIPNVDTILLLRPTESATIFLQQLGRGLRLCANKTVLTVLDLIGQVHKDYRYDIRYRALIGGTSRQIQSAIQSNFPRLPPGCAIKLDPISKEIVLDNLRSSVRNARQHLVQDLKALGHNTRLSKFLQQTTYEIDEIYSKPSQWHCFTELRQRAGFDQPNAPQSFLKRIGRLIHVDDEERLEAWLHLMESEGTVFNTVLPRRSSQLKLMLFSIFSDQNQPISTATHLLQQLRHHQHLRHEIIDLLRFLLNRIRSLSSPISFARDIPIRTHATYSLQEISAAYNILDRNGRLLIPREGVFWHKKTKTDLLFVTLDKSERDYSDTTNYNDYAISPTLFHWESQNNTSPTTPTGQRYIQQGESDTNVILFVREGKKDQRGETTPYLCLGPADYVNHKSERPIKIMWKLKNPMPNWLWQRARSIAG